MSTRNRLCAALLAAAMLLAAPAVQAQERNWYGILGAGLTFGGDTLATVTFTDGSSEDIDSGGLVHLYGGAEWRVSPQFSLQATIGYHVDNSTASNAGLRFSRYPLELLAHFRVNDRVRLGGGVRFVNEAKLAGSEDLSGFGVEFDSTTGAVLEAEYLVAPQIGIKLRGVAEKYKPSGGGASVDGNHLGVYLSWYW